MINALVEQLPGGLLDTASWEEVGEGWTVCDDCRATDGLPGGVAGGVAEAAVFC